MRLGLAITVRMRVCRVVAQTGPSPRRKPRACFLRVRRPYLASSHHSGQQSDNEETCGQQANFCDPPTAPHFPRPFSASREPNPPAKRRVRSVSRMIVVDSGSPDKASLGHCSVQVLQVHCIVIGTEFRRDSFAGKSSSACGWHPTTDALAQRSGTPFSERGRAVLFEVIAAVEVAILVEVIVDEAGVGNHG